MQTVDAIFENGILRPVEPVTGIADHTLVRVVIEQLDHSHPLEGCFGILPDEDAREIRAIVDNEFERVDLAEWK